MPFPLETPAAELELPVIDISQFPQDFDGLVQTQLGDHPILAKISKACKEWGFFLLVHHGIPVDLLQKVEKFGWGLLSLPIELKERALSIRNVSNSHIRRPSFESFRFSDPTNLALTAQIYAELCGEGNPLFCETLATYALSVSNLGKKITKMILASLGLDADAFYRSHFENCTAGLRINGYPSRNLSVGDEALGSHTDPYCLTILYQDEVGGLQIRSHEGDWFNVKPVPHSFVINLGNFLKAWSNGRYRSAEHRVVYKGCKDRMSIVIFNGFPQEMEIWAPEEVVDSDNPRRYKPFTYSNFKQYRQMDKENNEKARVLDRFAGI